MSLVKIAPIWQPESQQTIFRGLLTALSFPGRIVDLTQPLAGDRTELGLLAALVDEQVTLADPENCLSLAERRLLSPKGVIETAEAEYVLCDATTAMPEGFTPRIGTIYRPEGGALLILRCKKVGGEGVTLHLTGPGIKNTQGTVLSLSGVHLSWLAARQEWCSNFPTGCDVVFCDTTQIAAIPRTTRVEIKE
jgi:alpha-D-ribose 1-methylphosphonate 5-triphosphate synthase subunit PhnH